MTRRLSVTVAVLTRRRPRMLAQLLRSFDALEMPADCDVRFLVVENDDAPRSRDVLAEVGDTLAGAPLDYVLETEPGIPFGRNRAAREAIASGHDLLAFVDDDEVVAADWLVRLIAGYRRSGAALIGAPLGIHPAGPGLDWMRRKMHACIARRYDRKAARARRRAGLDGTPGVTIVTNNWLAEVAIFRDHDLWFDEALRFTGGTDSKLSAEVKRAGLPTAWVADAHVYEIVPPERLTVAYQFARGRDQSNVNFRRKLDGRARGRWLVWPSILLKSASVLVLGLLLVPTNGRTLLDLARTSGWIAGRLGALLGRRSTLYERTTGE